MVIVFFLYEHILYTAPPMAQFDGASMSYCERKQMIAKVTTIPALAGMVVALASSLYCVVLIHCSLIG